MAFDKSQFIEIFKRETREHIQKLTLGLIKLEKNPKDIELLNEMMREAHSIKGSATMMGYKRIADIAHSLENGLEKALKKQVILEKQHFDALLKGVDAIEPLLEDKVTWQDKGIERPFVEDLCQEISSIFSGEPFKKKVSLGKARPQTEEESMRVDIDKLNKIVNISGELVISKIRLNELAKNLGHKELRQLSETIDYLTTSMQDEVMKVRMVPVSYLFNTFPRAMRDLAREKGKDIDFQIHGENTELDKAILDQLKDPIMHLLRNAVDHGIEEPEERKLKNKSEIGIVVLSAYQEGSQVIIEVSDDGGGIKIGRIKEEAVKKGLVSSERINDMVDEQIYQLLFTPGFSTKEEVSEVSGRGVGLDIVRDRIAKLKGMVEVFSQENQGSCFLMRLPLTLAISESLLVVVSNDIFAIPIDSVVETIRITPSEIKTIETKDAITVRGHILPLISLGDIFGLVKKGIKEKNFLPIIIVQSAEKRIAILVDELLGRQEIISKSLQDPLQNAKYIAGATILGSGRVVLILDIPSVIEASEGVIIKRPQLVPRPPERIKKKKTILLAEDVLTTAMLEKNILESVGYSVVIARDGKEALDKAMQESFDLIITDILMPRMDGFELVSSLRKTNLYKDVPIVVVTTRESDQDKRRGLEAGADAYILKSQFTSEKLLETLERLLG